MFRTAHLIGFAGTFSILALASSITALAQTKTAGAEAEAAIEEIIVTARKRPETLTSAPVSVYALREEDIQRYGVNDLVSAAKLTPGLHISRATDNNSANIYLRGVGTNFISIGFEQTVSINIDNVPINKGRAIFQALFDMEQLEVMRGPQALFFGKNSTAGVISIRTADPGDTLENIARAGYGFNGSQYWGEYILSTPVSDALGVRLALHGSSMNGGFFDNIGEQLNGVPRNDNSPQEDEYGGRLTLVYQPNDQFDLNFKVAGSKMENDGVNALTQLVNCQGPGGTPQPILGFFPNQADGCKKDKVTSGVALDPEIAAHFPDSRGGEPASEYTGYVGALTANYHWDNLTLTSVTGYYDYETWSFTGFSLGSASQTFGRERVKYSSLTQELRLASDFDGMFNFTAGLFYDDTDLDFSRAVRLFTAPPDPTTGRTDQWDTGGMTRGNTYSAFLELDLALTPTVSLSGGARYSKEEKDSVMEAFFASPTTGLPFITEPIFDEFDDDTVSPEVTLRWQPNDDVMLFLSFKEAYKSGGTNLSEIAFLGTTPETVHFESENAEGLEAGLKGYLFDRALIYSFSVYRATYKDLQTTVFDSDRVTLHVGNIGRFRTQGAELDLAYSIPTVEDLNLRASVYYNNAEYKDFLGACYTGQSVAQGCDELLNPVTGAFTSQDYAGRPGDHAPEWTALLGFDYSMPVGDSGFRVNMGVDSRYTSSYYLGPTLAPHQKQDGYVNLNAAIRLTGPSSNWELAVIGTNLTDELAGAVAIDHPLTGSGTGTDAAVLPDTSLVTGFPREIAIQWTQRF
jgi:outer membrane receptor protein involved in Fe transport